MTTIFEDIKNAFNRSGNGLMKLILINIIVFVVFKILYVGFWLAGKPEFYAVVASQMCLPADISQLIFRPWSLLTNMFFHEGFFHIIFNLLFFYWFGALVEEYLGSRRLISIYVLGGIFGGIVYILAYNFIPQFKVLSARTELLGASGAIYAVAVAAATLLPNYQFHLILIGPVRIVYIVAVYLFISVVNITGGNAGGNLAHLGGAVLGFIFIRQLQNGNDLGKPVSFILDKFENISRPKSKLKVTHSIKRATGSSQVTQEEIDEILDKINRSGYESLSKEEKQKLFSASQK